MQLFKNLKNLKNNLDPRLVLFVLVALIIFTTGSSILQSTPAKTTPTPAPIQAEISALPTPSPFPADFLHNEEQTVGPTIAASVLVLVVIIGVLSRLLQKNAG
jgi:hypothetical protein